MYEQPIRKPFFLRMIDDIVEAKLVCKIYCKPQRHLLRSICAPKYGYYRRLEELRVIVMALLLYTGRSNQKAFLIIVLLVRSKFQIFSYQSAPRLAYRFVDIIVVINRKKLK